jgi:adenylosuccinate synthase
VEADIVVDLQYGDSGKGKVTHFLAKSGDYTHVLRYNGGANAGHTIFHNGQKFITQQIPAGVFFGVRSIIGSGCVVNPEQFFKEIDMLEKGGIDTKGKIFIAENAHVITQAHREEDKKGGGAIGTTGSGNGPAYRDKYGRTGVRAADVQSDSAARPNLLDARMVQGVFGRRVSRGGFHGRRVGQAPRSMAAGGGLKVASGLDSAHLDRCDHTDAHRAGGWVLLPRDLAANLHR